MIKYTHKFRTPLLALTSLLMIPSCANTSDADPAPEPAPVVEKKIYNVKSTHHGKASWYSIKTNFGTATASGQRLRNDAPTAAHKTLPMGTLVRVTNLSNKRSEIVTINDRGPYIKGRIIDVTIGTAEKLGFVTRGVIPVKVEVIEKIKEEPAPATEE